MIILKEGDRGPRVKRLQSLLKQLGYNVGNIDGIYGSRTKNAVSSFQRDRGILPTGVVDDITYNRITDYYKGFRTYIVKQGDTLSGISKMFNVPINQIVISNNIQNPDMLSIGQELIIPYRNLGVVPTDIDYTYEIMEENIKALKRLYPFIEIGSIGKSVLGKELYYIKLGNGPNRVTYNASHHALEWITSPLLMKFTENFLKAYINGENIESYSPREIWDSSTIYIIPMVNPDGVDLVLNGLSRDNPYYNQLIQWNNGSTDFSKNWSANIRGVDLNHNYNASFEEAKRAEEEYGVYGPGPTRYGGPYPESEPETRAMVKFTREGNFRLVIAYHSQGEVIFWQYKDLAGEENRRIAEVFSRLSGYRLGETIGISSYGGYKDWFIKEFRRPGYTIEVGLGKNPLPISQFDKIYNDNIKVLLEAAII
ncbi:M14 family zinc carboxypeptidase [Hathewaya histolytica]|uniref:M14 family zinc carboxypeptidase n=1 Tax=Hathewaya histolytica TaxID=1498 RepID=UPI003B66B61D